MNLSNTIIWINLVITLILLGLVIYILVKNNKESFTTRVGDGPAPSEPTTQFLMTDSNGNITSVPFSSIKEPLLYEADQAVITRINMELQQGQTINNAISTAINALATGQVKANTDAITSLQNKWKPELNNIWQRIYSTTVFAGLGFQTDDYDTPIMLTESSQTKIDISDLKIRGGTTPGISSIMLLKGWELTLWDQYHNQAGPFLNQDNNIPYIFKDLVISTGLSGYRGITYTCVFKGLNLPPS